MSQNDKEEEERMPPPPSLGLVEQTSLSVQHSRASVVLLPEAQLLSMTQNVGDDDMGEHLSPVATKNSAAGTTNGNGRSKPKSGPSISQMVAQELNTDGNALTREEREKQKNLEQQAPTWSAAKDAPTKTLGNTDAPVMPQPLPPLTSRTRSTSRGNRSDNQGEISLLESLPENEGEEEDNSQEDGENSEEDEDSCAPPQTSMDRQITDVSALTEDPALHGPSSRPRAAAALPVSEGSVHSDVLTSTTAVSRSELEEQVRRRILSEAVPAQVVPMTIRTSNGSSAAARNASNSLLSPLHMQPGAMSTGPGAPQNPLHAKDPEDPMLADATYTSQTTDATGNNLCLAEVNLAEDPKDDERRRKFRIKVATIVALGFIFVVAIVVGVLFARSKNNDPRKDDDKPPKDGNGGKDDSKDGSSGTESEALYQFLYQQGSEDVAIRGTPAERAYKWMDRNDIFSGADVILEYFALVSFYYATNGESWTNNTGWLDAEVSPCDWYPGTNCDRLTMEVNDDDVPLEDDENTSDRVLSLNLANNNLFGTIPAELGRLTTLFSLFLQDNADLTGTLPTEMRELDSLEYLDLSRCAIKGEFSDDFLEMAHESLVVFKMQDVVTMTGTLPISLVRSHTMKVLNLNNMGLRAQWPSDVLVGPHQVYLSGNRLTGQLNISDSRLFSWLDVTHLDLSYNSLSGTIPDAIGSMWANGTLVSLRLEGNDFDNDDSLAIVNASVCEAYTASDGDLENRTFVMDCFHEDYDCPCCTACCERGGFNCGPNQEL